MMLNGASPFAVKMPSDLRKLARTPGILKRRLSLLFFLNYYYLNHLFFLNLRVWQLYDTVYNEIYLFCTLKWMRMRWGSLWVTRATSVWVARGKCAASPAIYLMPTPDPQLFFLRCKTQSSFHINYSGVSSTLWHLATKKDHKIYGWGTTLCSGENALWISGTI